MWQADVKNCYPYRRFKKEHEHEHEFNQPLNNSANDYVQLNSCGC